jgi:hypothetical protein
MCVTCNGHWEDPSQVAGLPLARSEQGILSDCATWFKH